jgi:hypothetical protein
VDRVISEKDAPGRFRRVSAGGETVLVAGLDTGFANPIKQMRTMPPQKD